MWGTGSSENSVTKDERTKGRKDDPQYKPAKVKRRIVHRPSSIVRRNVIRGFTLIEVMLTVTILAVGIIGVIRAYAAMVNTLEAADSSIGAVCLLKDRIFEIEKRALEEVNLSSGGGSGEFKGGYGAFKWNAEVTTVDSSLETEEESVEEAEEETEEGPIMYLHEVKITVSDEEIDPVRRLSLSGYVEGYAERETSE